MIRVERFFIACIVLFNFISCKDYNKNAGHQDISNSSIEKGEKLANIYCRSCHSFPDPEKLDSKTWEKGVLPNMGPRLGIFMHLNQAYPSSKNDYNLSQGYYPSKPVINDEEWQNIIDYYVATSPDSLPVQKRTYSIKNGLSLFSVEKPLINYTHSATSFVRIIDTGSSYKLIVSDVIKHTTFFLDQNGGIVDSVINAGPVVGMDYDKNKILECNIGVLNPNNGKYGTAQYLLKNAAGKMEEEKNPLFQGLQRPVQISVADLNKDGLPDYLICEFGFLTGGLYWMENLGNDRFTRHVLRPLPGAIKAYIQDYNHDGLPDIWVLFAQGEEGIFLYTNRGNGRFDQEEILKFPPINGSSYFELADFNKDGFPDIVYTCGDNADYSPVLKPYHGVYIYMNDKTNHFSQKYFFPINGCYKAMARDFDGDGDLDIATISFFADYLHQPEEGFVYLKNKGNYDFEPFSIQETQQGRWLTMDAGDIDGDGKTDLILGNFSIGPAMNKSKADWAKSAPVMILRNTGK